MDRYPPGIRIALFVAALAVVFAGAWAVGAVAPIDVDPMPIGHEPAEHR
jgi:hypothetical protein